MQIFWNTLVICSLGLVIITVSITAPAWMLYDQLISFFWSFDQSIRNEAGVVLVKTAIAYGAILLEIFVFCSAGEYLSLKVSAYIWKN